ncbi:MAG: hypothetical protein IPJ38_18860 [Dechloromonas sp.]|uniref:Uncharacterized protein n=1 Tax=Candidatus Dechloromonas phosphorivorans TaxID=2899244 RepID=A0A935JZH0_9RHOO|nr:hypothetical protein [Candidatus Dechloromonas phosphorivorans]
MRIDTSFAEADINNCARGKGALYGRCLSNRGFNGEVQQIRLNPTNQQNVKRPITSGSIVANKDRDAAARHDGLRQYWCFQTSGCVVAAMRR